MSVSGRIIGKLLAQSEAFDDVAILVRVSALQVVEQLAALANHLEQATARMEILGMRLKMLGKAVDALGKKRNLNIGRPCVGGRPLELFYDLRFLRDLQSHVLSLRNRDFSLLASVFASFPIIFSRLAGHRCAGPTAAWGPVLPPAGRLPDQGTGH